MSSHRSRLAQGAAAAVAAVFLVGCSGAAPASHGQSQASGSTTAPAATGLPSASPPSAPAPSPGGAGDPGLTALAGAEPFPADWPAFPGFLEVPEDPLAGSEAIPAPTLREPDEIGIGLLTPDQAPVAVASLIETMGIDVIGSDGTIVRPGSGGTGSNLWLTEDEVRGLIAMSRTDAAAISADEADPPYTFRDLGRALAGALPGWTIERLAAAYAQAYAEHPDGLVARLLLGQPIEAATPLTRPQLWLLLLDGFVAPGQGAAATVGARTAANGPTWGTANPYLPPIPSPVPSLSGPEYALVLAHAAVLGYALPFELDPSSTQVHEGHGGPGPTVRWTAAIGQGSGTGALVSPFTGQALVLPRPVAQPGGLVTWTGDGLSAHGTASPALGTVGTVDGSGATALDYAVRREQADGHGADTFERATVTASIPLADLVSTRYSLPVGVAPFILGSRQASASVRIGWHAPGIRLTVMNQYDLQLVGEGVDLGFGGTAHGTGEDAAYGVLTAGDDGIYRGTLFARSIGHFTGEWGGGHCDRLHDSAQELYVVGRPIPGKNLQLAFYPASRPWWWFPQNDCPDDPTHSWQVGWEGGGPDARPAGAYIPFGTGRWTNPLVGYSVWLPSEANPTWSYMDDDDSSGFGLSVWYVRTELIR